MSKLHIPSCGVPWPLGLTSWARLRASVASQLVTLSKAFLFCGLSFPNGELEILMNCGRQKNFKVKSSSSGINPLMSKIPSLVLAGFMIFACLCLSFLIWQVEEVTVL